MDAGLKKSIRDARKTLAELKNLHGVHQHHRSIAHLPFNTANLAGALLLATVFTAAIFSGKGQFMTFWRACILFWLTALKVKLNTAIPMRENSELNFNNFLSGNESYLPSTLHVFLNLAVVVLLFVFTFYMKDKQLPGKVLIRLFCGVQGVVLISFFAAPTAFPYDMGDQFLSNLNSGYGLLVAAPVLLTVGYYIFNQEFSKKILLSLFIFAYFTIMVPHKAVLAFLIVYHFSVLYMPILYICFGPLLDVLLFVALYSWIVSTLPEQPTKY